jgi:hypothetical protein
MPPYTGYTKSHTATPTREQVHKIDIDDNGLSMLYILSINKDDFLVLQHEGIVGTVISSLFHACIL